MREHIGGVVLTVGIYLAIVLGSAAVGAVVAQLVFGQWFLGALGVGCVVAWFALPSGIMESGWDPERNFSDPVPPRRLRDSDRG